MSRRADGPRRRPAPGSPDPILLLLLLSMLVMLALGVAWVATAP